MRTAPISTLALSAAVLLASLLPGAARGDDAVRLVARESVLVLHSGYQGDPHTDRIDEGFRRGLEGEKRAVEVWTEYMGLPRARGRRYRNALVSLLEAKYAGRAFDAVVTVGRPALERVMDHRHRPLFRSPVVHAGVDAATAARFEDDPRLTGVLLSFDFKGTGDAALALHPHIQRFGVAPSEIPTGSRLINAPRSFFEVRRDTLVLTLAALLVLLAAVVVLALNVLQRRRMQRVLAASERRLDLALQVSRDGLWDWNLVTGECYYSPRWFEAMGLDPARVSAHISSWEDRVHPEDLDGIRAKLGRLLAGAGEQYESEHRLMHADGRYRWHRVRAKVVAWSDDGRPARMIGVESDVTRRRQVEHALREKQAQLDAIFENSPAEIFLKDAEGRYVRVSREFERRFDVRNQDVAGKFPEDIHYEELAKCVREHDGEVLRTGKPVLREERARLSADGKEHEFLTLKFPTFDDAGKVSGLGAIATDVTEYRRAERELAERTRLLRLVYDNVPILLAYVDRELRIRVANREAEQWYGRPLDRIIGRAVEEVVGPEAWAQIRPDAERALKGQRVEIDGPRSYAGGTRWVTGALAPDVDENGEVQGYCLVAVDITERKRADDAVRESESLLRLIYDNVPVMLAYVDRDLRYRAANAACADWFGKPLDSIIGYRVDEVVGAEAWKAVKPEIDRVLNGEAVVVDGLRPYAGGPRWVSGTVAPNFGDNGEVHGYCVMLADISERKQAEEKLKTSEQLLRLVYDHVPVWLAYVDKDLRYRLVNSEAAGWLGMPAAEVVGRRVPEIMGEETFEAARPLIERALEGEVVTREGLVTFGGERRWVSGVYVPHRNEHGGVDGYIALLSDISSRKRTEDELEESEKRLRLVADNVPGMLVRIDAGRRFQFVNREAERWIGLPESEVIGRPLWEVLGDAAYQSSKPYVDRVLAGEQVSFELERSYPNGTNLWAAGTFTPDYDDEGNVRGYYALLLDVSERRLAQETARQAQLELLEQQRNERASVERELARVRDQLIAKTRLAAVGEVAASVAHDLRNPLGAIRNAKFYLSRKLPESEGKWREYLDVMEREIVTADRIIHDLMDMTRSREPELKEIDLEASVRDAFDRIRGCGSARLEIRLERTPFLISADPDQLARVLDNLLMNSVQAMGGEGRITVSAESGEDVDRIQVQDSGPGVSADLRGRLFEPLITDKAKGTGLGLAICRQIVERHGGHISLGRSDDKGTVFVIELPHAGLGDKPGGVLSSASDRIGTG